MLSITLKGYTRACAPVTGGISNAWVFDPVDFDWTTGVSVNSYASVALRAGATAVGGAKMFPINFVFENGDFKATQKSASCSNAWDYELNLQLAQLTQSLSDFMTELGKAACCSGLGIVLLLNDGSIIVMGERYVNASPIPRWVMRLDGATLETGKTFQDFQGGNAVLKGTYNRAPNFFTGGAAAITAFE